jgi:hypothetical protein
VTIADGLIATATEEERHKWTTEDLAELLGAHSETQITSYQLLKQLKTEKKNPTVRYDQEQREQLAEAPKVVTPSSVLDGRPTQNAPYTHPTEQLIDEQRYELEEDLYNDQTTSNYRSRPIPKAVQRSTGKNISEVARMLTDDMKYSGNGEDEALDHKMRIFYDVCNRVSLPRELLMKAFPALLKGIALDHFYSHALSQRSLEEAVHNLKNFFEGLGFHRRNLNTWNSITLNTIIARPENTTKSTTECLRILINTLTKLKFGLEPSLRSNSFLNDKLVTACQSVPACKFATYDPPDDVG